MKLSRHQPSSRGADDAATDTDPAVDRHQFSAQPLRFRWRTLVLALIAALVAVVGIIVVTGTLRSPAPGDAALGQHALADLSPFERQVLADKHVTAAELEESITHFTGCLTEAGIEYEVRPGPVSMGSIAMYGGPAHGWAAADQGAYDAAMDRCIDEVSAVENVWILQGNGSPGVTPLPGLREALDALDTSGW